MNAIPLTKRWYRQSIGLRREARKEQGGPARAGAGYREWTGAGSGVETALFVSVQAVMIACIVLVAAQTFATV